MICWMNGQYVEAKDLAISPFDHGFLYGLGFFETMRTYKGVPVFLKEHYQRLCEALNMYNIDMPYTVKEIEDIMCELNERNGGDDGYFRIDVSAGVHDLGLAPTHYAEPTIIIFRKELAKVARGTEKEAVFLTTVRNHPETAYRTKSHHYGNNVLARMELPNLAQYEGLFLTKEGYMAEGITSNVFWVHKAILYTPAIETGILPGITRAIVLRLAEQLGIETRIGFFEQADLQHAQECFVTTSIQELVPIKNIHQKTYAGADGVIYTRLHQAYCALIDEMVKRGTTC